MKINTAAALLLGLIASALPWAASAQSKTDAAVAHLGETYYNTCPSGPVVWKFRDGSVHRTSDGHGSYERNLTGSATFQNGVSYGPLVSVTVAGVPVRPSAPVPTATAPPAKTATARNMPTSLALPDSARAGAMATDLVEGGKQAYDAASEVGLTFWVGVWTLYSYLHYFIWCVMVLVWFWANFTKYEFQDTGTWGDRTLLYIQRNTSSILSVLLLVNMSLYGINFMTYLGSVNLPEWGKIIILCAVAAAASFVANKITPSLRRGGGSGHNHPQVGNGYKQLN